MGLFSSKEPRHASGKTSGQDRVRKHGQVPARRAGRDCPCGSGMGANVCHHKKVSGRGSDRDRVPTGTYRNGRKVSDDRSRKWGR